MSFLHGVMTWRKNMFNVPMSKGKTDCYRNSLKHICKKKKKEKKCVCVCAVIHIYICVCCCCCSGINTEQNIKVAIKGYYTSRTIPNQRANQICLYSSAINLSGRL
jgi:hypothetical protein